jgi:hypothetical protein
VFNFFPNCIFCSAPLAESRTGVGEHVFPDGIFGFWRSYDVCTACQEAFGKEVDCLAIQNVSLLNAMELLKLKDTGPHLDNLAWSGEDTLDKRKVPMVKRGSKMRVKVIKTDGFLECAEDDLEKIARPWLNKILRRRLSKEAFEAEYERFMIAYRKLAPGETYHSKAFGYSIRRRQTINVRVVNPTPPSFTRLIAKIVVCFVHYAFPKDKVALIRELQMLKDHARHGKPLDPPCINPLRHSEEETHQLFHRVVVDPDGLTIIVDISFFGCVHWRTLLHSTEPLILRDLDGRQAEEFFFVLDFANLSDRRKRAAFKYPNSEGFAWAEVQG